MNKYKHGLVSIGIPIWLPIHKPKKKQYIKWTLESLAKTTDSPFEIILFNDETRKESEEFLESFREQFLKNKYCKDFKILTHTKNMGWTGGFEICIENSVGEYFLIANDDLVFSEKWLSKMLKHMQPGIGAIGPTSDYTAGIQSVSENKPGVYEERVNWLIGFCMLFKRKALDSIKNQKGEMYYIDPIFYPGGSEELDVCIRLRKAGYEMIVARDVFIHHFGSRSLNYNMEFRKSPDDFFKKRQDILFKKHGDEWKEVLAMQRCPKIAICIPTVGNIDHLFFVSYQHLFKETINYFGKDGVMTIVAPRNLIHIGRSELARRAINFGAEKVFFEDDDMIIGSNTIIRLYKHQKDFVTALAYMRTPPYSPCYGSKTLVEIFNGSLEIEKIKIGDRVKTHTGSFRKVTKVFKTRLGKGKNDKMVWIYALYSTKSKYGISNSILKSTPNHLYYILRNGKKQWISARDLIKKDLMLYPYKFKKSYLDFYYRTRHKKRYKDIINQHKKVEVDENLARFLGLYIAEGCCSDWQIRFSFHRKEKEYIQFVSEILEKYFKRYKKPYIYYSKSDKSATVAISRAGLGENFIKWFGNGALNKRIPRFVFQWNLKNKLAFIKGFVEGDGSLPNAESGARVNSSNINLIKDFYKLSQDCGLRVSRIYSYKNRKSLIGTRIINNKGGLHTFIIFTASWYKLLNLLNGKTIKNYIGVPIFRKEIKQNKNIRYVYNLEVEKDNSYIVNSSSVHNCIYKGKTRENKWLECMAYKEGLVEIEASGLSCALINISAIKKVLEKKKKQIKKRGGLFYISRFGEDMNFSQDLLDVGVKSYCDTDLIIQHLGEKQRVTDITYMSYHQQQEAIKNQKNMGNLNNVK